MNAAFISEVSGKFEFPKSKGEKSKQPEQQKQVSPAPALTVEAVRRALLCAQVHYCESNSGKLHPSVNVEKADSLLTHVDIKKGFEFWERGGQPLCDYVAQRITDVPAFLRALQTLRVKPARGMGEFLACLAAKRIGRYLFKTASIEILSATIGGSSRSALFYASTGKGNESTSEQFKNLELVRKIQRAAGGIMHVGTEPTQNSACFGINGFARVLDVARMVTDEKGLRKLVLNPESPFYRDLVALISSVSDETLRVALNPKG